MNVDEVNTELALIAQQQKEQLTEMQYEEMMDLLQLADPRFYGPDYD